MSFEEKIKLKNEQILKKKEKIKREEEAIKKLEKEIEEGLMNEIDIPYEDLVKFIKQLKN